MASSPFKSPPKFTMACGNTTNKYSGDNNGSSSSASVTYSENAFIPLLSEPTAPLSSPSHFQNSPTQNNMIAHYYPESASPNQSNYLTTLSPALRPSHTPQYTNSQVLRGQWLLEQRLKDPIPRPLAVWVIGVIDILSVVSSTGVLIYDVLQKPFADLESHIWQFFQASVFIIMQLLMGIGLLTGLRSINDSSTLWYCKLWICCQYFFLLYSISFLFFGGILLARLDGSSRNKIMYIVESVRFAYRVACLIIVKEFKGKLDKSQKIFEDAWQEQRDGTGEFDFPEPPQPTAVPETNPNVSGRCAIPIGAILGV